MVDTTVDITKADFSGWATKANLKCSDGRTIMPNAFQHQDGMVVPLVWQHGHREVENVLGHALLEHRPEGVYAYGFFNDTPKGQHAKQALQHKDVNRLSIWANQLVQRGGNVLHGAIRELSLVLSGANPGAVIENIAIRHSDDEDDIVLEDEALIFPDLPLEHSGTHNDNEVDMTLNHAEGDEKTIKDVYDSMSQEQKDVLHYMVGQALEDAKGELAQSDLGEDATVAEVYETMTEQQQEVLHFMVGEALASVEHSDDDPNQLTHQEGYKDMKHNIFEDGGKGTGSGGAVLSHDDMKTVIADATRRGSLKDAVEDYALAHGIENIDTLFPDARPVDGAVPEWIKRRTEWVGQFLGAVRKSPMSRIKTQWADITHEEARAKGYVKGTLKKEEFFSVSKRTTTPTTVYKKQKLDRDDVVDITDFDVIAWLKGEMRVMLDEEIARAILMGDGRDISHEDKIDEQSIRPIATDHELFTTQVNVNIGDANSSVNEIIDALINNRRFYRGSGLPTLYTSETYIAMFLTHRDNQGRRIYKSLDEVASDIRVREIIAVEAMEENEDLVGIMVNPLDYVIGADKGGEVNLFDDFDIDYNNYKYLIETRLSGALVRMKSAIVLNKVEATTTLVSPDEPTFNPDTGVVTIPSQTGVVYQDAADDSVLTAGAQTALADGESLTVNAVPDTGYAFNTSENDTWTYTYTA